MMVKEDGHTLPRFGPLGLREKLNNVLLYHFGEPICKRVKSFYRKIYVIH